MRLWSKAVLAALLAVGLATAGQAQTPANPLFPTTGTREIELRGNFIFEPDDAYDIMASYGPFLNPNVQVGGEFSASKVGSTDLYGLGAFANYHFATASPSQLLPFAGVFLGYTDGDGVDGSVSYGLQGGAKYFLNSSVAFTAALVYRNLEDVDDSFGIKFGLAFYLR